MVSGGPTNVTVYRHLRADGSTAFCEDFRIRATIEGSGSIAGQTFAVELFDAADAAVSGATVAISDATLRQVTATFAGLSLDAGVYRWTVFRTDTGTRTETAWGTITVKDVRRG